MLYFAYTGELVGRFLVLESRLKVALPLVVARERVALCLHSRGIECDQLLGDVLDGGLYPSLRLLPVARAEAVELDA